MLMLFCTFISQNCGVLMMMLGMKNNEKMKTSRNHWYILGMKKIMPCP